MAKAVTAQIVLSSVTDHFDTARRAKCHVLLRLPSELDLVHDLVYIEVMEINVHEAKTNFSKLLKRVEAGEEVTIARAGVPVAKLVPAQPKRERRKLGIDEGKIYIAPDFDAPLPDEVLAGFYTEIETPKKARRKR